MVEKSFDDLDELQAQIRLRIAKLRQTDPVAADELKDLLRQLEDWVESLVVDSLKLRSLAGAKKSARGAVKGKPGATGSG